MKNKTIYIISLLIFISDLIIKDIVLKYLLKPIEVITNFFTLYLVKNTGGAFSIFNNNVLFLSIISIMFLFIIIRYICNNKNKTKLESLSLSFILGGLIGNLFDRLFRHGVIDYLSFKIFNYDFPIFNLADIFITSGVILLIINEFRGKYCENN